MSTCAIISSCLRATCGGLATQRLEDLSDLSDAPSWVSLGLISAETRVSDQKMIGDDNDYNDGSNLSRLMT